MSTTLVAVAWFWLLLNFFLKEPLCVSGMCLHLVRFRGRKIYINVTIYTRVHF